MKYEMQNGIHVLEVDPIEFHIVMCDKKKKNISKKTYVNAGFFGNFKEGSEFFTLPAGHVVCDYEASGSAIKSYCQVRGKFIGPKYYYSGTSLPGTQFTGKKLSTLIVKGKSASIQDVLVPPYCDYAISGVPIMRNGADVTFATYVRGQGWDASTLYGTWHVFVGLKTDGKIYVMGMKTTTGNMITSAEAYRKFKAMGFRDVIKLDGGGSFYMKANGRVLQSTSENRQINTIIVIDGEVEPTERTYPVPTRTLKYGCSGNDVRWLQQRLGRHGCAISIDGSFGFATKSAVQMFQRKKGLVVDGIAGKATIAALQA